MRMFIQNSNIVTGNGNIVDSYKEDNSKGEINWKYLEKVLESKIEKMDSTDENYSLAKQAQSLVKTKNKGMLKRIVQEHIPEFTKDIFSQVAAAEIINLINQIVS